MRNPFPILQPLKTKYITSPVKLGDGENTSSPFDISPTESRRSRNLCSDKYPALSVRKGRSHFATALATPNALGQRNNQYIHAQDGTVWKRWDGSAWQNVKTGLADAKGKLEEYSTGTTKYTLLFNGTDKQAWDGSGLTDLTQVPASRLFTTHKGRIYVARDNDIVYSALNKINDYTTSGDAGTIDVTNAKGPISAIATYDDFVTAWTEFSMHRLLGTGPSNFNLVEVLGDIGCISDRSVVVCNKLLYWCWHDGMYVFSAGYPEKVSDKVDEYFKNINLTYKTKICSGAVGDFLFVSIPYGASATENNLLLKLDTRKGKWYVETGAFVDFVTVGKNLYGLDSTGQMWNMLDGTDDAGTAIEWYFESGPSIKGSVSGEKTLSEIWLIYDLPIGSTLNIYTSQSVDNDDFALLQALTPSTDEQNSKINIPVTTLQGVDWYRLKFAGTGPCTIHYLEEKFRIKK